MTIFKKPESDKKVRRSNLVIGYYMGKAIVKDEENNILYFIECEECHAPEGTYIENEALTLPLGMGRIKFKNVSQKSLALAGGTNDRE